MCCHFNLANLHFPINFYAFSSSSPSSFFPLCLLSPLIWLFSFWLPLLFSFTCFFWCVRFISLRRVCVVRWQPAAATHSSPPWPRSQGRRVPTARSPLPLPAAPPLRGLTLKLLLTRYCKSHPGKLQTDQYYLMVSTSLLPLCVLHL